jgi:hypothetical protein
MAQHLDPELERRIRVLENPAELGAGLAGRDWFYLVVFGIVLPVICLIWGWSL